MGNKGSKKAKTEPKTEESCFFSLENQKQKYQIKLRDATPSNLQNAFGLQSLPKTLIDENGVFIFHKGGSIWSSKLVKNSLYKVRQHAKGTSFANTMEIPSALKSLDIHCAIVCSQAAQLCGFKEDESKREEIKTVFNEDGIAKYIDVICPSIYGEVQYILARSTKEEVLYIAFGGDDFSSMMAQPTKVEMEFLKDGEELPRQIKGDCNKYIWKQSKSISAEFMLEKIFVERIKRVVVCGHGVGGAIANTFALRLQLKLNLIKAKNNNSFFPELVCITFGAPMCLSKVIAEEVGHLDNFFNIINIEDPVPTVLEQAAGVANLPGYIKDALRKELIAQYKDILELMTKVFHFKLNACADFVLTGEDLLVFCRRNKITSEDIKCPFYPLGWYIFFRHDEEGVGSDYDMPAVIRERMMQSDKWNICYIKNADLATQLLAKARIQGSHIHLHSIDSYFKMVSLSISRDYRSSLPTEHNEPELRPSCVIINFFPPKVDQIKLTIRSIVVWN